MDALLAFRSKMSARLPSEIIADIAEFLPQKDRDVASLSNRGLRRIVSKNLARLPYVYRQLELGGQGLRTVSSEHFRHSV